MRTLVFLPLSYLLCAPVFAAPSSGQSMATTILILMAVIALILVIAKALNRLKLPAMGLKSGIKLVAQMPLGQKERILLLEVNDEQMLVGVTANQINLIKKLDNKLSFDQQLQGATTPMESLKKNVTEQRC